VLKLTQADDTFEVCDTDLGVPHGDPETFFTICRLSNDSVKAIRRKHTKRNVLDVEAYGEELIDRVLIGWRGVVCNGEPVPCELQYKLMLDSQTLKAIGDLAGTNERGVEAARGESFRPAS
jgi:hypothetical protein